jgi:hypothetical protein
VRTWNVDHNVYPDPPPIGGYPKENVFPRPARDITATPLFLSKVPQDADYLRLASDSPLARCGAGGAWPSYVGALPPGPAPKGGDWFTRLRERWLGLPKTSQAVAPINMPEPPPLVEWLKGRTILTVSQDGKGQFKTIQAALNALQPGQVVKVLDRGPYRERLVLNPVPKDSGLVSERQTILELSGWGGWQNRSGHRFQFPAGFRISGLAFVFPMDQTKGIGLLIGNPSRFLLEDCLILAPPRNTLESAVSLGWSKEGDIAWVRNCLIRGQLNFSSTYAGAVGVAQHNFFDGEGIHNLGASERFDKLVIRQNVFSGRVQFGDLGSGLKSLVTGLEISNNTMMSLHPCLFDEAPDRNVTICNNLRRHAGLASFHPRANASKPDVARWYVGHNVYPRQLRDGELGVQAALSLPQSATDMLKQPMFLSLDETSPDFLRVDRDSLAGAAGLGGSWPTFIGALPPGPAPKEGDWFTRLRERWRDRKTSVRTIPAPTRISEPLLAEWLKGRTILTVSQDGKGRSRHQRFTRSKDLARS